MLLQATASRAKKLEGINAEANVCLPNKNPGLRPSVLGINASSRPEAKRLLASKQAPSTQLKVNGKELTALG